MRASLRQSPRTQKTPTLPARSAACTTRKSYLLDTIIARLKGRGVSKSVVDEAKAREGELDKVK
eukprot:11155079-Lingulodinium_polyedra.AAC.1